MYLLASSYSCGHPSCRAIRTSLCSVFCFSAAWRGWRVSVPNTDSTESVEVSTGFVGGDAMCKDFCSLRVHLAELML